MVLMRVKERTKDSVVCVAKPTAACKRHGGSVKSTLGIQLNTLLLDIRVNIFAQCGYSPRMDT